MDVVYYHRLNEKGEVLSDMEIDEALTSLRKSASKTYYYGGNIIDLNKRIDDRIQNMVDEVTELRDITNLNLFDSDFNSRGKEILILAEKVIDFGNKRILYVLMKSKHGYLVFVQGFLLRYRVQEKKTIFSTLELIEKNLFELVGQKIKNVEGNIPINFRGA